MPEYLLSIYQPDSGAPDAETMARIVADLHRLTQNQRERDCLLARRYAVV